MKSECLAESLIALYNRGAPYNVEQLSVLYSDDIIFTDPAHSITGLSALCAYLNYQYSNVQFCEFLLKGKWHSDSNLFLQWDMAVQHPKLNGGKTITVNGISHLLYQMDNESSAKIFLHRDFFDLGQLLYENIPVIGAINRQLKKGLTS
jgi:hypothetical protein